MHFKKDIIDTNADGNCFFRALYGYALHNDLNGPSSNQNLKNELFEQLLNCFNCDMTEFAKTEHSKIKACDTVYSNKCLGNFIQKDTNEEYFVHCLRNSLKLRIENNLNESDKIIKDTFDNLQGMDDATYQIVIETTYPKEFCLKFPTQSYTYNQFKQYFAESIGTFRHWVSQTEVRILQHILSKCDIDIHIYNNVDNIPSKPYTIERDWENNHMNIYLINFDNAHYGFVLYSELSDEAGTGGGKRKIKVSKNKIMLDGKIYVKHIDKKTNKIYIKKYNKKLFLKP